MNGAALPPPSGAPLRERARLVGEGLSRIARGLVGPTRHDRLWMKPPLVWIADATAPSLPAPPPATEAPLSIARTGPLPGSAERLDRAVAHAIAIEPPRYAALPPAAGRGLLVFVPWIVAGGADRSVRDLIEGLARREPSLRMYLVATQPLAQHWGPQAWAAELLPLLRGWFSLPEIGGAAPSGVAASLCERLSIDTVLVMNSGGGFEALPQLRRLRRPPRTVTLQHAFNIDPETGKRIGWPVVAASRYNNLLDAYAVISESLRDQLVSDYYVSPTKIHVIRLGTEVARFAEARRARLVAGETPSLLWLGRLSPEKNPLTAVEVAHKWREHHPQTPLRLTIAGTGSLAAEVKQRVVRDRLEGCVELLGEVADPVPHVRAADTLLLTSISEGIPMVLYEAAAADLPFITPTRNTSIRDEFSAEDAFFVEDATDAVGYIRVLEHVLAHPDEARAKSARNFGRREEFDKSRYIERMQRLLFPGEGV